MNNSITIFTIFHFNMQISYNGSLTKFTPQNRYSGIRRQRQIFFSFSKHDPEEWIQSAMELTLQSSGGIGEGHEVEPFIRVLLQKKKKKNSNLICFAISLTISLKNMFNKQKYLIYICV